MEEHELNKPFEKAQGPENNPEEFDPQSINENMEGEHLEDNIKEELHEMAPVNDSVDETETEISPETENKVNLSGDLSDLSHQMLHTKSNVEFVYDIAEKISLELHKVIIGQYDLIELMITGLLSNGHILIEGVPGIAKTLTAKLLAQAIDVDFKRLQFTPDLMPSDVIGTSVFNTKTSDFSFRPGPVFTNIVLVDEINRAPAKTQSALFEVMEEKQVSVDGETYQLDYPFFIVATQNPIEQEGTYKLPEAQLDRFLFRIKITYPGLDEEKLILHRFKAENDKVVAARINKVFDKEGLQICNETIELVHVKDELIDYIAKIVDATRNSGDLFLGASPRASLAIMKTSKTLAAINGREYVTPDDIKKVAFPVLNHRIILSPEREMEGVTPEDIIQELIDRIEIPR